MTNNFEIDVIKSFYAGGVERLRTDLIRDLLCAGAPLSLIEEIVFDLIQTQCRTKEEVRGHLAHLKSLVK